MLGYHGAYLKIDLNAENCRRIPLDDAILRECVGGVGLGAWLMLNECAGEYAALAPEAPLVFAFAPLVGTAINTSAKAAVLSKSPLTERLNDAMVSSQFALTGKGVGADALVISGACEAWSTLYIEPEGISLRPSPELRGLSAQETERRIREAQGEQWSVVTIGLAGENLVPYALMSHDGRHAGRGGTGTVMGAKKLKAIAVKGAQATTVADEARFSRIQANLKARSLGHATEKYRTTGTLGNLLVFNRLDILPTRNFQAGSFDKALELSAEKIFTEQKVQRVTCADCMIGCEKRVTAKNGNTVRLEYENMFALGPLLDIHDSDAVLEASQLCDHYGLDTITTGGTLAFAMECVEKGLLDLPELRFADGAVVLEAIHKIARREDYGELLALGSRALARKIGRGSEAFAAHVKGLEMPGYHPARLQTLGLGFAVGSRGADHNKSSAYDLDLSGTVDRFQLDEERIGEMINLEDQAAIIDSLILCKFVRRALQDFFPEAAEMLSALTGASFSAQDLQKSARTIHHLKKIFNRRQGWRAEEDTLPERFFAARSGDGLSEGIDPEAFRNARARYYHLRGWDDQGRPAPDQGLLEELRLA
ncbi:MAG: aldehyde ferredoxin oxidoreductase family protein [SAR324 cluster bacterium]|nr:aldehyde ferredoxin oxidoreductase family protein [SAR324 cluster bacterium]MCZ6627383.1 aldehyde ferredoxin oxidoreductase family protein [SAR324 cluster bacterium]MCZ6646811.1 aldehyde ferredoxin oxidoreductase family protein [SAR324 cluster bacterium]MCZ6842955.1 aldehyde ferredoxin oxidoreductase family protein [SAR324 cluster bacterium]